MKPKPSNAKSLVKAPAERVVKDIRRATRRHFSAEDKIRIVLDGLRGDDSIAELCRREGIAQSVYYSWSTEFMEAGKHRLAGDTARAATRTLDQLGIARRTFYRWYDRYLEGGPEALEDRPSAPSRVWNRIGDDIQQQIIDMALDEDTTALSPKKLSVRFTYEKRYFVSDPKGGEANPQFTAC